MSANSSRKSIGSGVTPKKKTPKKPTSQSAGSSPAGANKPKSSPSVIIADQFDGLSLQSRPKRSKSTGLLYDAKMSEYCSLRDSNYQECPDRILEPFKKCKSLGLVERCTRIKVKPCTVDKIKTMHDAEYVDKIASVSSLSKDDLISMEHSYDGVQIHEKSMECALMSAGATIDLVENVVTDKLKNGLAIIRPPGHHATKSDACGYCYFNNVAIAARHCLDQLGLKKILIVDWDVHHGQGTQYMFYDDPRVLYVSIHRYENGWFWPNLRESNFDFIGTGKGQGHNINIPLNKTGMTDGDYLAIFYQIILPVAMEYNPDVVIVSAGYDCALGCPEGEMEVTPPAFSHFVHKLKALAHGRLAVVLEGGYCLQSLSESVAFTLRGLLDDACPQLKPSQPPQPELISVLLNSINILRKYWTCFQYQKLDEPSKAVSLAVSDSRGEAAYSTEENRPAYYEFDDDYPRQSEELKRTLSERINAIVKESPTRQTANRTSYVYDDFMMRHKCVLDPTHPERPQRIERIHNMLKEYGLLANCLKLPSRKATQQELALVHSVKHINEIKAVETKSPKDFDAMEQKYNSIYLHTDSYKCALMAAGSLLNVVDSVMTDQSRNGFAIIRPPGHHAEKEIACGFCFFNNVPVAVKYAQKTHKVKKVAIIDWDVHHGNGTQHMFEDDDSVLYISLHRYDDGFFFPGSEDANYDKVGKGKGAGYNINIAFNSRKKDWHPCRPPGDPEYIAAFQQIIMPVCYEFSPDLVFISAGFDAARGDPLGGYKITPGGYAHMTHMLSSLAGGRLIMALEGGYNLNSISESFSSCVDAMLGGAPPRLPPVTPDWAAVESIKDVIRVHKKYWKSLCCDAVLPCTAADHSDEEQAESESKVAERLLKKLGNMLQSVFVSEEAANSAEEQTDGTAASSEEAAASGSGASACAADNKDAASPQYFAVVPLKWCAHIEDTTPLQHDLDSSQPCQECSAEGENWVCLTCYQVFCSRFVNEHMLFHALKSEHRMVLSYADLSVWCYACDSYVHNVDLLPMKNSAHKSKFGHDQPDWARHED